MKFYKTILILAGLGLFTTSLLSYPVWGDEINPTPESVEALQTSPAPTPSFPAIEMEGKPFDPACLATQMSMESELEFIDLHACESPDIKPGEYFENEQVTRGISYTYTSEGDTMGMSKPYIAYNAFPLADPNNPDFGIIITWSGGGTGNFSTLYKMRREGDMLHVLKTYAGGDRCNGGIGSAGLNEKGQMSYGINITPYDMLVLGGDPNRAALDTVEPFEDLDACAICCYGQAHFAEDDFTGVTLNEELNDWLERKYPEGEQPAPEQERQACFDTMISEQASDGKNSFTVSEWERFINQVEQKCLGKAAENEADIE